MIYRHKKTGTLYQLIAHAIDCTNNRDGTEVVVYAKHGTDIDNHVFVRDRKEFEEKFHAENV